MAHPAILSLLTFLISLKSIIPDSIFYPRNERRFHRRNQALPQLLHLSQETPFPPRRIKVSQVSTSPRKWPCPKIPTVSQIRYSASTPARCTIVGTPQRRRPPRRGISRRDPLLHARHGGVFVSYSFVCIHQVDLRRPAIYNVIYAVHGSTT
jgi:hypothetical protein